jgi:hypothetical protein
MFNRHGGRVSVNRPRSLRSKPAIEGLEQRSLLSSITLTNPAGPITSLTVGGDGSFQVHHSGFMNGQVFYPNAAPADAGILLRQPDGTVDGLSTGGNSAAAASRSRQLHSISQVESPDGQSVVSVADNSTDGTGNHFQLTQVVTYHPGDEFFTTTNTILNQDKTPLTLDVFAAADIYLADSDKGVGFQDTTTGAVGGTDATGNYHIFIQPNGTPKPTNFTEEFFNDMWTTIGTPGADFNNNVLLPVNTKPPYQNDPNYIDNAAGLEWKAVTIQPGQTATISYFWSFGASVTIPNNPATIVVSANTIHAVEGSPFQGQVGSFTTTASGATASDFTATVNWGDGTTTTGTVAASGTSFTVTGDHTYARAGAYPLVVSVHDKSEDSGSANGGAAVADAALTVTAQSFSTHVGDSFSGKVATFTDANPQGTAADFSAEIAWGDGTSSAGTISSQGIGASTVFSISGSHVYAQPTGLLPTTLPLGIVVNDVGGSVGSDDGTVTLLAGTTQPGTVTLSGGLDPASDSGVSNSDGITNVTKPTFDGLATPGAFVSVQAQPTAGGAPISLGMVQAAANGEWTVTPSSPLANGTYSVTASGASVGGPVTNIALKSLTIDTVGPRVTALTFSPSIGQIVVTFQDDRSGMDAATLANMKFYSFAREPHGMVIPFNITNVTVGQAANPTDPVPVTVTINGGARIGHGRRYVFTVASGGVRDVAGNALDGTFNGTFPSGNGTGGSFETRLVSTNGHSLAPLPINLPFFVLHAPKPKPKHK